MYDQIYQLAKNSSNLTELKKKLKGLSIDASKNGDPFATAAAQLAKEGKDDAVERLRFLGASVDNIAAAYASVGNTKKVDLYLSSYNAKYSYVAYGYAQAQQHQLVEKYYTKEPYDNTPSYQIFGPDRVDKRKKAILIAQGYALVGDDKHVDMYLNKSVEDDDSDDEYSFKIFGIKAVARCYAFAGNHKRVEWYLNQYTAALESIIEGYARAGNHVQVEKYWNNDPRLLSLAAYNYATAEHHQHVKWCYNKDPNCVLDIISGYAEAGANARVDEYLNLIEKEDPFREKNQFVEEAAYRYAFAGHDRQVTLLLNKSPNPKSLYSAIRGGYELANNTQQSLYYSNKFRQPDPVYSPEKQALFDLLNKYLSDRNSVSHSSGTTKEYFYGSFFSSFQKSFSEKFDAVEALKNALADENVNLKEHLSILRNGNLGKQLRAFIQAGSADALVGTPVRTVSEFVHALEEKNIQLHNNLYK